MNYCKRCILPDTRPGLHFNADGVCSACTNFEERHLIDWQKREELFEEVVAHAKRKSKGYDCLIPVSGGKDSTWQTIVCLEKGLNPLCVTWRTPARTKIGQQNLDNLIALGVDHIDYQINPLVEKKFMLEAFKRQGTTGIPMHMALFNIPLKISGKFDIPLVIWGENSAFEYGGSGEEKTGFRLNSTWLKKYGVTNGTTAEDWVSETITSQELTPYFGPAPEDLEKNGTLAVFLGYYFDWDVRMTYEVASKHGFKSSLDGKSKTGIYDFADIDDDFISIHHFLKWHKFGLSRSFDNLSLEIRNGRLTRMEAIERLKEIGNETPTEDIKKFCDFVGISENAFFEICEKFRNTKIWSKEKGCWMIKDFLVSDWSWN